MVGISCCLFFHLMHLMFFLKKMSDGFGHVEADGQARARGKSDMFAEYSGRVEEI